MFSRHLAPILASLGALVMVSVLSACGRSRAQPAAGAAPQLPSVTVAQVLVRPLRHSEEFTGNLQAVNTVDVHPRVSGFIDSVNFTEGARVTKGQLLFQIDPRPFDIEIERLTAELTRARSKLDYATAGGARAERLFAKRQFGSKSTRFLLRL